MWAWWGQGLLSLGGWAGDRVTWPHQVSLASPPQAKAPTDPYLIKPRTETGFEKWGLTNAALYIWLGNEWSFCTFHLFISCHLSYDAVLWYAQIVFEKDTFFPPFFGWVCCSSYLNYVSKMKEILGVIESRQIRWPPTRPGATLCTADSQAGEQTNQP